MFPPSESMSGPSKMKRRQARALQGRNADVGHGSRGAGDHDARRLFYIWQLPAINHQKGCIRFQLLLKSIQCCSSVVPTPFLSYYIGHTVTLLAHEKSQPGGGHCNASVMPKFTSCKYTDTLGRSSRPHVTAWSSCQVDVPGRAQSLRAQGSRIGCATWNDFVYLSNRLISSSQAMARLGRTIRESSIA